MIVPASLRSDRDRHHIGITDRDQVGISDHLHRKPHQYLKKTQFLYFHAILRYKDVFKKEHWTTVCAIHTYGHPLDDFTYCEEGNGMDSGEADK
jgi:hypothetical protein